MKIKLEKIDGKTFIIMLLYSLLSISVYWNIFGININTIFILPMCAWIGYLIGAIKVIK